MTNNIKNLNYSYTHILVEVVIVIYLKIEFNFAREMNVANHVIHYKICSLRNMNDDSFFYFPKKKNIIPQQSFVLQIYQWDHQSCVKLVGNNSIFICKYMIAWYSPNKRKNFSTGFFLSFKTKIEATLQKSIISKALFRLLFICWSVFIIIIIFKFTLCHTQYDYFGFKRNWIKANRWRQSL